MSDARTVLAEWQQRTDAATPGSWDLRTTPWDAYIQADAARNRNDRDGVICNEARSVDAEFIVTAREAMPKLLAAVEAVLALQPHTAERYTLFAVGEATAYNTALADAKRAINHALEGGGKQFDRMIEQVRREAAGEQREKDAQIAEAAAIGWNHDYDNGCFDAAAAIREAGDLNG